MSRFKLTALFLLLLSSSPVLAGDLDSKALEVCRNKCMELSAKVTKALHDDMLAKGVTGAVATCAETVDAMCRRFSAEPGLTMERISVSRLREQKRLGSFEASALERMIKAGSAGDGSKGEEFRWERTERGFVGTYVRAITIEPICLTCHGPKDLVPPEVRDLMVKKYGALPSDNQVGEIKGAIVVSVKLPEAKHLLAEEPKSEKE
jgi:hypothetical protein